MIRQQFFVAALLFYGGMLFALIYLKSASLTLVLTITTFVCMVCYEVLWAWDHSIDHEAEA